MQTNQKKKLKALESYFVDFFNMFKIACFTS